MSEDRKPYFRFNPNAYETGRCFERSDIPCSVCSRPCDWRYVGNIYSIAEPEVVCASCIADGRLEAHLGNPGFSLHDIELDDADPALEQELMHRTAGVACFNPYVWPVLDRTPLAFLHYGDEPQPQLFALPEVRKAIAEAYAELGWSDPELGPNVLLFRAIDGDRYKAVIDLS